MSLAVSPGEVLGLIGPNGSGKTTLLNLIAGTIRPDAGRIHMAGEDVTRLPNHLRVRKRINRTFQLVRAPPNMPAIGTVMAGVLYGAGERVRFKDAGYEAAGLLGELNLLTKADRRFDQLTYIEQKRVELARPLATKPRAILLDEWLSGLSPSELEGGCSVVWSLAAQGIDGGARALPSRYRHECRIQDRGGTPRRRCCATPRSSALTWATTMLEIDGLDHAYGRHSALRDVPIRVRSDEVVAILGANGAGKTTLLNAVAGLLRPSAGSIRFRGNELMGLPAHRIVDQGIATVTEIRHLFGLMSVRENLTLGAFPRNARESTSEDFAYVFELFPHLAERQRQTVRTMSGGEQQMVAVGRALMARPSLLLLDEPSLGLAPLIAKELFAVLERVARKGDTSILLVEQNARRALKMADSGYLLALGRIVGEGSAKALAQDKAVAESYLGL